MLRRSKRSWRSLVLVAALPFTLGGCVSLPRSFPWSRIAPESDADESSPAVPEGAPRMVELVPSGVAPATAAQLERCRQRLGLVASVATPADPTNFGERESRDVWGRSTQARPQLIVLHETVISEPAAVQLFQTPHPNDADQVSYHVLIARDGRRLRLVPDANRAYGSGMSAFGDVTQRRQPGRVGAINNIALHVSLVTPGDGRDDRDAHSGYTGAQYRSLADQVLLWQAQYGIPMTRVTTHAAVDRSHSRYDPRSFRWSRFDQPYQQAARLCGFERFNNHQAGL